MIRSQRALFSMPESLDFYPLALGAPEEPWIRRGWDENLSLERLVLCQCSNWIERIQVRVQRLMLWSKQEMNRPELR